MFLGSSLLHSCDEIFVTSNVSFCNMLLKNACKKHHTLARKTNENGPKIVPKPLQNRAWRGLEATWEPSLKRGGSRMGPATPQISQDAPKRSLTWPKRAARQSQDGQVGAKKEPTWLEDAKDASTWANIAPILKSHVFLRFFC